MYSDSKTNLIGNFGEDIVYEYLISLGYEVKYYGDRNSSHEIDFTIDDGQETYLADAKTKRCRAKYEDTGIDSKDYRNYKKLSKKLGKRVFIYFVDYYQKWIYGNYLDILDEYDDRYDENGNFTVHYPMFYDGVAYFPMDKMIYIRKLTDKEIETLERYSKEYDG